MNRVFKTTAAIFAALVTSQTALAEWTEIQSVIVPNDPFNETYSVRPYVSTQLLVTKDGCCRRVQLTYLAFGSRWTQRPDLRDWLAVRLDDLRASGRKIHLRSLSRIRLHVSLLRPAIAPSPSPLCPR
jgi:hypothetical protein